MIAVTLKGPKKVGNEKGTIKTSREARSMVQTQQHSKSEEGEGLIGHQSPSSCVRPQFVLIRPACASIWLSFSLTVCASDSPLDLSKVSSGAVASPASPAHRVPLPHLCRRTPSSFLDKIMHVR